MDNNQLINDLKSIPNLYGICRCGGHFKISDAFLFDGLLKKFPDQARIICKQYQEELKKIIENGEEK
jgi:hypothetical protein